MSIWMEKHHPEKPFERYADDIIVHCKTEKQAIFIKAVIQNRLRACKLQLHPEKTKIVYFRGESQKKYPRSLDFLGFTLCLQMVRTKVGLKLMTTCVISNKSKSSVLAKFWSGHTNGLWHQLNTRLIKWVMWEKDLSIRSAIRWIENKYRGQPDFFPHWALVSP